MAGQLKSNRTLRCIIYMVLVVLGDRTVQCATFSTRPQSKTTVILGGTITLNCAFSSLSSGDNYFWFMGPNTLFLKSQRNSNVDPRLTVVTTATGQYDLKISNAALTDQGTYHCELFGQGRASTSLTVLVAPGNAVIETNNKANSNETDVVQLNCSSTGGNPAPSATWWIGTQQITTDIKNVPATLGGTTTSTLTRTLTRQDNGKVFTCRMVNEANKNSPRLVSHNMTVRYAPTISLGQYKPYIVLEGSNVVIRCIIDANPNVFTVHWYQDGLPKIGNTGRILEFKPARQVNAARYTCEATNAVGKTNSSVTLQIQYAPKVTVPSQKVINESQAVSVECNVDAKPAPHSTKWRKENATFVQTSNTLKLSNVRRTDAGTYKCSATNRLTPSGAQAYDQTESASTKIIVQYPPGKAAIGVTGAVLIGQPISLVCNTNDVGVPKAEYVWHKVGSNLPKVKGQRYRKEKAELSDNGLFECVPQNIMGQGQASRIKVNVNESPSFLQPFLPSKVSVDITRQSYSLTCRARGRPQPLIRWKFNGVYIEDIPNHMNSYQISTNSKAIDTHSINVTSVLSLRGSNRTNNELRPRDSGNYSCHISHPTIQQDMAKYTDLKVQYKPIMNGVLNKVASSLNDTAVLKCEANAVPVATFEWERSGQKIVSGGRNQIEKTTSNGQTYQSILKILETKQSDFGEYVCYATNTEGRTKLSIDLSMKTIPDRPTDIEVISATWESIHLSWKAGFNGGYTQVFNVFVWGPKDSFKEHSNIAAAHYNLTALQPGTKYIIKIYGSNKVGKGELSENITASTQALPLPVVSNPKLDMSKGLITYTVDDERVCIRIDKIVKGDTEWKTEEPCARPVLDENTYKVEDSGNVEKVRVSICLQRRNDVCGQPVVAEIIGVTKKDDIPEETIIIVAAVCGAVVLVLCIILVVVCCKRRQNNKKHLENETASSRRSNPNHLTPSRPNNTTTVPVNHQRGGSYDNPVAQDVVDFDDPATGGVYSHQPNNHYVNNKYNGGISNGDWNHYNAAPVYDDDNRRNILDEEEMNRRNRPYLTEPPYISYNQDLKKEKPSLNVGLKPDNMSYHPSESGYSTPDPTKPKKVIYEVIV